MDALPNEPAPTPTFAAKRIHARVRWTRFATGVAGLFAFGSLLWSSYRLGYEQGRQNNASRSPESMPASPGNPVMPVSFFTTASQPPPSARSTASASSDRRTPTEPLIELP